MPSRPQSSVWLFARLSILKPIAFMVTGGQVPDCKAGEVFLEQMPEIGLVNLDKGYDSNDCRLWLADHRLQARRASGSQS
ncbi:transposase [Mesorhizobium shangrilense]|uniref:transposase n=1 Tax=Mesorhizobium shangrilense TaxID=460060 RepID=UPI003F499574